MTAKQELKDVIDMTSSEVEIKPEIEKNLSSCDWVFIGSACFSLQEQKELHWTWLGDRTINAAQELLKQHHPHISGS